MLRRSPGLPRRAARLRARYVSLSLALGLTVSAVGAIAVPGAAGATPQSDLASQQAQARQLQAQIDANTQRADVLDEQYLQAQQAVGDANDRIASTQRQISETESRARQLRAHVGSRAAQLYMGAGNNDPIGIDVASVQDLGSRAKYGEAAAAEDAQLLDQLRLTDEQLQGQQRDLQAQRDDAQRKQHDAENARRQVAQINAKTQQLLASTNANIKRLAAQIDAQRRAAEAAAAQARYAAMVAQQQAAQRAAQAAARTGGGTTNGNGGSGGGGSGVIVDPASIPAPSAGAAAAVAFAYAQLGKPYQYAGTGPGSYDCSGLTMMAWAQGGVGMAHGSQAQYAAFPKVPISQLQPGDLVFFGDSGPTNHHVGIVVGGGMMIDAPHTGAFVEKVSYMRGDLVPLGARP